MNIKDRFVSLDLAKQLKGLNVLQQSEYYWVNSYPEVFTIEHKNQIVSEQMEKYSAFNTDELIYILPALITKKMKEPFNNYHLIIQKQGSENIQYIVNYECDTFQFSQLNLTKLFKNSSDNKFVDSLAKCLIKVYALKLCNPV